MKTILRLAILQFVLLTPQSKCVADQIFVICHGLQLDGSLPVWTYDMSMAINSTLENPCGIEQIKASVVDLSGGIDTNISDNFIIFDWSSKSNIPGAANNPDIVNPLVTAIISRINALFKKTGRKVDLCPIGHSRGCLVIDAALKELGNLLNLGFVHVTYLDPQFLGTDGNLDENPGGVVDWTSNYYQRNTPPVGGHILNGAFNVNLSNALKSWNGVPKKRGGDHNEVFCWLVHTFNPKLSISYQDQDLAAQRAQFLREKKNTTLFKLYGQSPLIENFNSDNPLFMSFAQGVSSAESATVQLIDREKGKTNQIVNRSLQMTPDKNWIGASAFFQSFITGDFAAEFTFQMIPDGKIYPADGIAFAVVDPNQTPSLLGHLGAHMGYGGMGGFAIVFDAFQNQEHNESPLTNRKVWLRTNGQLTNYDLFGVTLPEPITSGNKFRVRLTLDSTNRQIELRIYSYGADQVITAVGHLPANVYIPDTKVIIFTAATGSGRQIQTIDDVIVTSR